MEMTKLPPVEPNPGGWCRKCGRPLVWVYPEQSSVPPATMLFGWCGVHGLSKIAEVKYEVLEYYDSEQGDPL